MSIISSDAGSAVRWRRWIAVVMAPCIWRRLNAGQRILHRLLEQLALQVIEDVQDDRDDDDDQAKRDGETHGDVAADVPHYHRRADSQERQRAGVRRPPRQHEIKEED